MDPGRVKAALAGAKRMRNTAEGTVKAQTNAIYRKAGVSGRPQLLSLFIEDLMDERATGARPPVPKDKAAPPQG